MTLAIVLLVAGLIVGGGIGYFAAPIPTRTFTDGVKITFTVDEVLDRAGDTELKVYAKITFEGKVNFYLVGHTYTVYVDSLD
jgi:hypothetical protein